MLTACGQNGASQKAGGTDEQGAQASGAEPFSKLAEADGNFAYNAAEDGVELHHSDIL
jgi:hypothetical protein